MFKRFTNVSAYYFFGFGGGGCMGSFLQRARMKAWCNFWTAVSQQSSAVSFRGLQLRLLLPLFTVSFLNSPLTSTHLANFLFIVPTQLCICLLSLSSRTFEKEGLSSYLGHCIKVAGTSVWGISRQPERDVRRGDNKAGGRNISY